MKKINILFVLERTYSLFNKNSNTIHGGAEVQLFNLANGLAKNKDFGVGFVVRDHGPRREKYEKIKIFKWKKYQKKNLFTKITSFIYKFKAVACLRDILDLIHFSLINKTDILVTRAPGVATFKVYFVAKILRKKFIYMVAHDEDCKKNHSMLKKKISKIAFNFSRKHADLIIVQSFTQKKRLNSLGINQVKVIRSGQPPSKALKKQKKGDYLLWIGRAEKWKRPEILLAIAKKFTKYKFVMVFPGISLYKEYTNAFVKKIAKIKNITFIEKVPYDKIDALFKDAKIYINTSVSEGFPNTFIEAWKNNAPVISLNVDPDDLIKKHNLGYQTKTMHNMCEKIKELMSNNKKYKQVSDNCYKFYKENFHITKAVQSNIEVYKDLMK